MRAKPVLLPPPYCVRKPKTETWSLLDLYRSASLSRSSSLETLARLGWRTSLHSNVRACPSQLHVRCAVHLHDHLATSEKGVADELARAQSNLRIGHVGGWTFDLGGVVSVRWAGATAMQRFARTYLTESNLLLSVGCVSNAGGCRR